jgi:nitrite reductase/ring-hydroxylating ferredoxin subunit
MARFVKVGRVGDLAEVVQVDGLRIALFHVCGRYYALEAACPHEGGPLADGVLQGLQVICPWHGYDFHLRTGDCGVDPGLRVLTYPVKVQGDDILIEVA